MNKDDFIQKIENYYYPYDNDYVKKAILKFISKYSPDELNKLYGATLLYFSRSFKIAPDIKVLNDVSMANKIHEVPLYPEAKELPSREDYIDEPPPDNWREQLDRKISNISERIITPVDEVSTDSKYITNDKKIQKREEKKKQIEMQLIECERHNNGKI